MSTAPRSVSPDWPLHITIDAAGHGPSRVQPRVTEPGRTPHLVVVTPGLLTACLDAAAVQSIARAWAEARARGADVLPSLAADVTGVDVRPSTDPRGYAAPVANIVAEGPSRWEIIGPEPRRPYLSVSSHWLTVRVHDTAALDVCTQAWAKAHDMSRRLMRGAGPTFKELTATERGHESARRLGVQPWTEEGRPGR